MIFESIARSAQSMHLSWAEVNTISKWIEARFQLTPCHQKVLLGAPKTISEPIARSTQTVPLSCVNVSTISKWTETSFYLTQVT
jgi:hypothetical protein